MTKRTVRAHTTEGLGPESCVGQNSRGIYRQRLITGDNTPIAHWAKPDPNPLAKTRK